MTAVTRSSSTTMSTTWSSSRVAGASACASSSRRPRRGHSRTTPPAAGSGASPTRTCRWRRGCVTVDEHVHARLQSIPDAAPMLAKAKFPDGRRAALVITDHAGSDLGANAGGAGIRARRSVFGDRGAARASAAHHEVTVRTRHRSAAAREPRGGQARRSALRRRLGDRAALGDAQARRAAGDDGGARHLRALARAYVGSIISPRPTARRSATRAFARRGSSGSPIYSRRTATSTCGRKSISSRGRSIFCARIGSGSTRRRSGPSGGSTRAGRRGCGCFARSGRFSRPSTSTTCTRRRRSIGSSETRAAHRAHVSRDLPSAAHQVRDEEPHRPRRRQGEGGGQRAGEAGAGVRAAVVVAGGAAGARDAVDPDAGGARRSAARGRGHEAHRRRQSSDLGADAIGASGRDVRGGAAGRAGAGQR